MLMLKSLFSFSIIPVPHNAFKTNTSEDIHPLVAPLEMVYTTLPTPAAVTFTFATLAAELPTKFANATVVVQFAVPTTGVFPLSVTVSPQFALMSVPANANVGAAFTVNIILSFETWQVPNASVYTIV